MQANKLSRREFLRLGAVSGLGLVAAGCVAPAPSAPAPAAPAAESAATAPAAAAAAPGLVTLNYAHWGPPTEAKSNIDLAAAFEKVNPNVKIQINHIPQDFYQKILTLIAGGTPPDVFYSGEAWVWKFGHSKAALDQEEFIKRDKIDESIWYDAGVQQLKDKQGRLWGLPTYLGPFMVYYNKDVFDAAGVPYPIKEVTDDWTFDDYRDKAHKLTKVGSDGKVEIYGAESIGSWLQWIPTIRSFGGEILNDDRNKSRMDEPEAIDAIQWLADNMLKEKIAPSPLNLTEIGQGSYDLFLAGKIGMFSAGRWGAWQLDDPEKGKPRVNWGVAPWPKKTDSLTPVLFVAFIISSATKYADQSWEFVKYTTATMEGQLNWNSNGLGVPILKEAADSREYLFPYEAKTNHDIYARSLQRSKALPYHDQWDKTIDTYATEEYQRVWIGEATAAEACKKASDRINKELAAA